MQVSGHIRKRVKKDGSASYQIVIEQPINPLNGKRNRIYKTVKGTKKEAEKIMRQMMDDLENQCYVKDSKITVGQWVTEWLNTYLKNLSPTTLQGYKYQIDNYIIPSSVATIRLQDLTTTDVQKWINGMYECSPLSKEPMSAKTVKNIYHNLSAALEKATMIDLVKKNVCKAITLPKVEKYSATVYDENDVQKLLDAARGTDMELILLVDISLGLRRGELLGLKWKHIDLENGLVTIEDNLVQVKKDVNENRVITKAPKSNSGKRVIPISGMLINVLKKARTEQIKEFFKMGMIFTDDEYVVHQANGKPYKPNTISCKFNEFLKKNNLKHIRLHDIRHTNATLMLKEGISPKVAQMRLGHSDFATTMNIYSHVLKSVETEAAEKLDNVIFGQAINL